jgi:hypothetical protein
MKPHPEHTDESEQYEAQHDAKRSHMVLWLVVACTAFLLIMGAAGYGWWKQHKKTSLGKPNPSILTEDRAATDTAAAASFSCSTGLRTFQDARFGLGFCYPDAWGEAKVTDDRFDPSDAGARWMIAFTHKPAVKAGLVTADWSTEVARDGTCQTPVQEVDYGQFSPAWQTNEPDASYASRDISSKVNTYRIEEYVDNLLTNGACLRAYGTVDAPQYVHLTVSYLANFTETISTPKEHIESPNVLIPEADRAAIAAAVASVRRITP